jgi:hypothetical protein
MLSEGEWDDVYVEERRGDRRFKPINIREWNQIIRPQNPIIFSFYYGFMADYPMEDVLAIPPHWFSQGSHLCILQE